MAQEASQLESALATALEVVEAQRAQLAAAQEELAQLSMELQREQQARSAAEEKLREASVDFARKLAGMQAKVIEAERDVVLGGQVLVARSAPGSSAGPPASSVASPEGTLRVPGETPRRLAPVPPPPRDAEEPSFSRAFVARTGPHPTGARRTRSAQQRLSPIEPTSLA
mmetsp:Transcript_53523/g.124680  ORF Transcript_53523/g.124680 Transcript_53523/m.124680 type:complete len:170 (+) Transcript_53523:90-599(+)